MTTYATKKESDGYLKRGPMVSVPHRKLTRPVPDVILARLDEAGLTMFDKDHSYALHHGGRLMATVRSAGGGDWIVRRPGEPGEAVRSDRDQALNDALLPSLVRAHRYEIGVTGYWCLKCTPLGEDKQPAVAWPCPPLTAAGVTDDAAEQIVEVHRIAAEEKRLRPLRAQVDTFNHHHDVLTGVRYWTGVKEGAGRTGQTIEPAILWHGHPVVRVREFVTDKTDYVALSHVEPQTRRPTPVHGPECYVTVVHEPHPFNRPKPNEYGFPVQTWCDGLTAQQLAELEAISV
ncbi:hypothetical protein [Actinoplanes sp. URMC 104]|uniref:hypothetical protein n=1 Tax=Actinoplanes sp. URMC 104 TaxID=3423409 RepID=UPI003F1D9CDF